MLKNKVLSSRLALGAVGATVLTMALMAGGASPARADTGTSDFTIEIGSELTINDSTPQVLDIEGAYQGAGGSVIDYPNHGGINQKWQFVKFNVVEVGDEFEGQYEIDNANSDMCLTTDGVAGDQVMQQACTGNSDQLWDTDLSSQGGSMGTIQSASSGLFLDIYNNDHAAGTIIDTWPYNGGANQIFVAGEAFEEQANTTFTATINVADANNSGLVLGIAPAGISEQAPTGKTEQEWTFIPSGSFNYEIQSANSGLCLTTNGDFEDAPQQEPCTFASTQLWHTALNPSDPNAETIQADYNATPLVSGYYLQADANGAAAGTVADTNYLGSGDEDFTLG